jgi:hypothetical protein
MGFVGSTNLGAVTTNPAAGAVLATTGSLTTSTPDHSANYKIEVFASSTADAVFDLQSVFSGSVVSHTYLMCAANTSVQLKSDISYSIPDGVTLQVVNVNSGLLGTVQVNIYWAIDTFN